MPEVIDAGELAELREIVALMWEEYNADQECDYRLINNLIEQAERTVANGLGGYDRLERLARNLGKLRPDEGAR